MTVEIKPKTSWYNFRTAKYERIDTPDNFEDYIPQSGPAQNLYRLLIDHQDNTPLEAALHVLSAATGNLEQK